ncbi:hypothetical protein ACH4UT_33920 [Streptomyces sp. NPDC020799]|uniref:hypothetical protein n=1 Tax=Streptomyces sp. NPDC020799 TaxID=3365091 RepID=UPI0037B3DCD8
MFFDDLWMTEELGDCPEVFEELSAFPSQPGTVPPERWVLPGIVPITCTLAQGEHICVALNGVRSWPSGITLDLVIFARRAPWPGPRSLAPFSHQVPQDGDDRSLTFSALYADGRHVSTTEHTGWPLPRARKRAFPEDLTLRYGVGAGDPFLYRQSLHLSPLPPLGPLTLTTAWPDRGVPENRTELDTAAIRDAARQVVEIWPDLLKLPSQEAAYEFGNPG